MVNWNKFSLFKLPNKYKKFEFTPRYYDERKERLDKKLKEYDSVNTAEAESKRREIKFRAETKKSWMDSDFSRANKRANFRLVLILIIVLIGVYFLFQYLDGLEAPLQK